MTTEIQTHVYYNCFDLILRSLLKLSTPFQKLHCKVRDILKGVRRTSAIAVIILRECVAVLGTKLTAVILRFLSYTQRTAFIKCCGLILLFYF